MKNLLDGEMIKLSRGEYTPFFLITLFMRKFSELIGLDDRIKKGLEERKKYLFKRFQSLAQEKGLLIGKTIGYNDDDVRWFAGLATEIIEQQDIMIEHDRLEYAINALKFRRERTTDDVFGKLVYCYADLYEIDDPKTLYEKMWKTRRELLEDQTIRTMVENDNLVSDEDSVLKIILEKIKTDYHHYYKPEYESDLLCSDAYRVKKKQPNPSDRKFIIFDRDYDDNADDEKKMIELERTDEDYYEIIDFCSDENRNYEVLLSTPFFEFWLLMHHEDANYKGIKRTTRRPIESQIIHLEKITGRDEKELKKKLKNIDPDRFNAFYKDTFMNAVEMSESDMFTTDVRRLVTEIGTNVGIKLRSLIE